MFRATGCSDMSEIGIQLCARPIKQKDIKTLKELFDPKDQAYNETCTLYYFDKDTFINDNQKYAWGLFNGDEVVSVFTVGWEDLYDAMFVGDVYTKPKYRGNKYSIKLIEIVLKTLMIRKAVLTYDDNTLINLYEKIGFVISDEENRIMTYTDIRIKGDE